jgi:2-methylcitrate dehydratase PrpD
MDLPVKDKKSLGPVMLVIHTYDDRVCSVTVDNFKGSPENPMSREDCIEKFIRCVQYAGSPFPEKNIESCIDAILNLEKLKDVTDILKYLLK